MKNVGNCFQLQPEDPRGVYPSLQRSVEWSSYGMTEQEIN